MTGRWIPARWLRRLSAPLGVLGLAVAVGVGGVVWVRAERAQVAERTAAVRAELRELRDTLSDLRRRAAYMDAHRTRYRQAKARGLTREQDRLAAGSTIERLAVETGVTRASYTFKKADRTSFAASDRGGDGEAPAFVHTPVVLELTAQREGPIFGFLDALQTELPGYLPVRTLTVRREAWNLDQAVAAIRDGRHPTVLRAEVTLDWVVLDVPPKTESPDA